MIIAVTGTETKLYYTGNRSSNSKWLRGYIVIGVIRLLQMIWPVERRGTRADKQSYCGPKFADDTERPCINHPCINLLMPKSQRESERELVIHSLLVCAGTAINTDPIVSYSSVGLLLTSPSITIFFSLNQANPLILMKGVKTWGTKRLRSIGFSRRQHMIFSLTAPRLHKKREHQRQIHNFLQWQPVISSDEGIKLMKMLKQGRRPITSVNTWHEGVGGKRRQIKWLWTPSRASGSLVEDDSSGNRLLSWCAVLCHLLPWQLISMRWSSCCDVTFHLATCYVLRASCSTFSLQQKQQLQRWLPLVSFF